MRRKNLNALCKEYGVDDFFEYISAMWIGGNKSKAISLFQLMHSKAQKDFLSALNNREYLEMFDLEQHKDFLDRLIYALDF